MGCICKTNLNNLKKFNSHFSFKQRMTYELPPFWPIILIIFFSWKILQEGLYYFGGKNSKGEILGELKILRTDCKPMQWITPETKGLQPKARYSHSMDYS